MENKIEPSETYQVSKPAPLHWAHVELPMSRRTGNPSAEETTIEATSGTSAKAGGAGKPSNTVKATGGTSAKTGGDEEVSNSEGATEKLAETDRSGLRQTLVLTVC